MFLLFFTLSINGEIRKSINLNNDWITIAEDSSNFHQGFENMDYPTSDWTKVNVPHNWDRYEGYRRGNHGNRHGCSWYRKMFSIDTYNSNKHYFLHFEGVGSYATVWVNGIKVGYHAGGRTTFTLDITNAINTNGEPNLLSVMANHPSQIRDLPWVCGGCSDEWGFSEGSQPFGIFRPVHLIVTDHIRVEPFGVHLWNDKTVNNNSAIIHFTNEIKNYSQKNKKVTIINSVIDSTGNKVVSTSKTVKIVQNEVKIISGQFTVSNPTLWSIENPYLYTIKTQIIAKGEVIDQTETKYGIRWISWPQNRKDNTNTFQLNGKPVFLNGTAEYEHNLGKSHAFSNEQIDTRVAQVKAAGYNAFRDAHQPHNFRYHQQWDSLGILWWTQMGAHIWFDNPDFKANFKQLLREWVKERRNSPSIILWGLQNESRLPTKYAEECANIIRQMDPTTSSQRLVTTCNGGTGTDWNVIQNWSGTYSGDPYIYDQEISEQLLNGEYGAWRSLDLHTEGEFKQDDAYSEDRMTLLMEMKIRLAEAVKDKCCGQFHWLMNSHENPGRIQNGEGYRDIDRLGPINYKGIFTPWGEPTDAFYMFRSNYAPKETEPMVYIASHTWPNRFTTPGIKDSIIVYTNCDEVELFNGAYTNSLGKLKKNGIGTHLTFNQINISNNVISAIGYIKGEKVATDIIILNHLPKDKSFKKLRNTSDSITSPLPYRNYLYRVNCGGPDYIDVHDNLWMADIHRSDSVHWGSTSWTDSFDGLPYFYGSQRRTFDPIAGSNDWNLFQSFRYGRDQLKYHFPIEDGDYSVELFFVEPWYGIGGGLNCDNWRLFDVAINEKTIHDVDIWESAGHNTAYKLKIPITVKNGAINISFPNIKSGQAIISAIAISSANSGVKIFPQSPKTIIDLEYKIKKDKDVLSVQDWLDWGTNIWKNESAQIVNIPSFLFASNWIQFTTKDQWKSTHQISFKTLIDADVYIAIDSSQLKSEIKNWSFTKHYLKSDEDGLTNYPIYTIRAKSSNKVQIADEIPVICIAACPISKLEKAADQRPIIKYELDNAQINNSQFLDSIEGRTFVHFGNKQSPEINWNIETGIADKYTVRIKYYNNSADTIIAIVKIETATGIEMMNEEVEFIPKGDQWKTFKVPTPSTINAGDYVVKLISVDPKELKIDYLEIQ